MILDADLRVSVMEVPQRRGGVLYAIDEVGNPSAAILQLGGVFGDDCLIVTTLMGTSDDGSREMARMVARELVRGFVKLSVYYVGPEAIEFLRAGRRLTHSARSPREYDLSWPAIHRRPG